MSDMMASLRYEKELADAVEALSPKKTALQNKAVSEIVNRARGLNREAVLPFLPLLTHEWSPATPAGRYVPQVSMLLNLVTYATTPPSTGNCVVTLTIIPPGAGVETVATATILNGQSSGEASFTHTAPAGSWLFASITGSANGASGVSITAVRRLL